MHIQYLTLRICTRVLLLFHIQDQPFLFSDSTYQQGWTEGWSRRGRLNQN
uniref:Uncharacterized protein n=1 Tax=Arundo donax TaxID=35708 RepID=A0A0A9BNY5_ARUDO